MVDKEKIDQLVEKVKMEFNEVQPIINNNEVIIEVSARHLHISRKDLDILFGKDYELTPIKGLSQPGQYAAKETVRIIGNKSEYPNVRILGPVRDYTQVEISITDSFHLDITPVLRMSGDIENTPGCIILGPKGHVELEKGVIVAKRHFHCTPETAEKLGLKSDDPISIEIKGERGGILKNIIVRVSNKYSDAIHLDTDESNALGIKTGDHADIIK